MIKNFLKRDEYCSLMPLWIQFLQNNLLVHHLLLFGFWLFDDYVVVCAADAVCCISISDSCSKFLLFEISTIFSFMIGLARPGYSVIG